jgi:hypothetical protein
MGSVVVVGAAVVGVVSTLEGGGAVCGCGLELVVGGVAVVLVARAATSGKGLPSQYEPVMVVALL